MAQGLAPVSFNVNYDDPRFQRRLHQINASPVGIAKTLSGGRVAFTPKGQALAKATSDFANERVTQKLALNEALMARERAQAEADYRKSGLGLRRTELSNNVAYNNALNAIKGQTLANEAAYNASEYGMKNRDLKDAKSASRLRLILGAGAAGYSAYEGAQRRKEQEESNRKQEMFNRKYASIYGLDYDKL